MNKINSKYLNLSKDDLILLSETSLRSLSIEMLDELQKLSNDSKQKIGSTARLKKSIINTKIATNNSSSTSNINYSASTATKSKQQINKKNKKNKHASIVKNKTESKNKFDYINFFLFILTSSTSAVFNFSSRILFNQWFSFTISIFLAYCIGITVAYVLARLFVFNKVKTSIKGSAFKFIIVNIFGMLQTWLISMLLAYRVLPYYGVEQYVPEIAHFTALSTLAFTSYFGHKYFSFK